MVLAEGNWARERCPTREAHDIEQLLPGIPDDVTLNLVATKLSWADCYRLSPVSRRWRHAVRSGAVQAARVHNCAMETLVLLSYTPSIISRAMRLFSMRENRCYKLPPFPYLDGRIPPTSQCIPLDGKIYVLGGEFFNAGPGKSHPGSNGVYVLDLAVGRQWKQCARMIEPRVHFGCAVLNGKIYVLGGLGVSRPLSLSEVYDPKEDTWSQISALPDRLRLDPQVATVGAKLLVHGGLVLQPADWAWRIWHDYHNNNLDAANRESRALPSDADNVSSPDCARRAFIRVCYEAKKAKALEVYDPVKKEWSVGGSVLGLEDDVSFMHKGKLHVIDNEDIQVHETETDSWTHLHKHSICRQGLADSQWKAARSAVTVDDRLLMIVEGFCDSTGVGKACLLQSRGLGSVEKEIKWERTPFTVHFDEQGIESTTYSMHPIQL